MNLIPQPSSENKTNAYNEYRDRLFWEKVEQKGPDDCWNWTGAITGTGYGNFCIGNKRFVPAHRYAFVYKHQRPIKDGLNICHHCDNPKCCNPNHLFEGDQSTNINDMVSKGRYVVGDHNGERNGRSKIKEDDVIRIKNLSMSGLTCRAIAKVIPLSYGQIARIIRGSCWRNI